MNTQQFDQFDELKECYNALLDMNRLIENATELDSKQILEASWNVIGRVQGGANFDLQFATDIAKSVRSALFKIYTHNVTELSDSLSLGMTVSYTTSCGDPQTIKYEDINNAASKKVNITGRDRDSLAEE